MDLQGLNEPQRLGVTTTEGPVLLLAGAGSGKTRVLTHRVAYLIEERGVNPYNILAITFTNKAANEMRERVDRLVGFGAEAVWVSTFHSLCVRILRRYGDRLGYTSSFTIYDTEDTKKLMKEVTKKLGLDPKRYKDRTFLNEISSNKNELIGPEEYAARHQDDFTKDITISVYREYQARLKAANAMDFDDLLVNTVELLKYNPDVLEYYQNRFLYIMVDEYQDTNTAQFEIIRLLAKAHSNLCVVGDDDQSIYKFRGANIRNILDFEKQYPSACVIKLEENYRSTGNILQAANSVIRNNVGRKDKTLFTSNDEGDLVKFMRVDTAYEEAGVVASDICKRLRLGQCKLSDCAILYRTNAQSRILEEKLINEGIAYKIVGGVNFYSRREIKDILAYLKLVANTSDEIALRRIINVPKRGIGDTSIAHVSGYALMNNMSLYDAMCCPEGRAAASRAASKIEGFVDLIQELREMSEDCLVTELSKKIIDETDYVTELKVENTDESKGRIENIEELLSKMYVYEEDCREADRKPSLTEFLEEVSLVADIDSLDENSDYVVLMTLHSAKGLEFPYVYMTGMEEGLFPSDRCFGSDDDDELEEERRLCYVGITRAIKQLTMTSAASRMIRGETSFNAISRFVKEIDASVLEGSTWEPKRASYYADYEDSSGVSDFFKPKAYKKPAAAPSFQARNFGTQIQKQELDYIVGDRVRHQKFGAGTVEMINDGGRDFEVTVEFDTVGRKKMFASFAKLERI